jgi:hypothetical protein
VELVVLSGADAAGEKAKSATRWIELPAGFTDNVLAGKQQRLKIETAENANADYSRAGEVVAIRAIVRTLARVAEMKQQPGMTPSASVYEALRARSPIVALESANAGRGTAVPRGVAQSVPGIMTFTVLMMTLIYGAVFLTIEKREGVLKRQMSLPISRTTILVGKMLGRFGLPCFRSSFSSQPVDSFSGSISGTPRRRFSVCCWLTPSRWPESQHFWARSSPTRSSLDRRMALQHGHGGSGRLLVAVRGDAGLASDALACVSDGVGDGRPPRADQLRARSRGGRHPLGGARRHRRGLRVDGSAQA